LLPSGAGLHWLSLFGATRHRHLAVPESPITFIEFFLVATCDTLEAQNGIRFCYVACRIYTKNDCRDESRHGTTECVSNMSEANLQFEAENMSGFREVLGFSVTEWEPNRAVITAEMNERHLNRNGFVHGGVFVSLLDSAAGLCGTYCSVPGNVRRCITISLNTHFMNPLQQGVLRVEAKVVNRGRKIFFVEARITCEDTLIATGQGTFRYVFGGENEEGVPAD